MTVKKTILILLGFIFFIFLVLPPLYVHLTSGDLNNVTSVDFNHDQFSLLRYSIYVLCIVLSFAFQFVFFRRREKLDEIESGDEKYVNRQPMTSLDLSIHIISLNIWKVALLTILFEIFLVRQWGLN